MKEECLSRLIFFREHSLRRALTEYLDHFHARRVARNPVEPPLPIVRSLHYFLPVMEEIKLQPLPHGYVQYLESKVRAASLHSCAKTSDHHQTGA